jgi:phospholipid/cholesterol/gamma-HCH transport system substrate-binding protein
METRAPYALAGLFALTVIVAVFGFVYWMHNTGGLGERTVYRIRFENSVSGLLVGAAVLFNGIRVGEVADLRLDPGDPLKVMATVAVAAGTPVRADTQVGLDFQGLTGVPVVALQGGTTAFPTTTGEPKLLTADPKAGQSMTQAARQALLRLDALLSENAAPLHDTITNLQTFAAALARNSDRLDNIVAGLERMTGGGVQEAKTAYDLSAAKDFPAPAKPPHAHLVIPEPTVGLTLDTQRILVGPPFVDNVPFAKAQWTDNVSKLVHARIIQSFDNSKYLNAVARPMEGLAADYQLLIDIRSFQISPSPDVAADVEFSAKIVKEGRIIATRILN